MHEQGNCPFSPRRDKSIQRITDQNNKNKQTNQQTKNKHTKKLDMRRGAGGKKSDK